MHWEYFALFVVCVGFVYLASEVRTRTGSEAAGWATAIAGAILVALIIHACSIS